jgi:ureidoglycolate dehydrogenase (NAD+)
LSLILNSPPVPAAHPSSVVRLIVSLGARDVEFQPTNPALAAGGSLEEPFLNGVAIALDLAVFGDPDSIRVQADRLGDAILSLPTAGTERIFLPGERGNGILEERERSGIPLARGTWDRLLACARQLGVAAPQTMQNVV